MTLKEYCELVMSMPDYKFHEPYNGEILLVSDCWYPCIVFEDSRAGIEAAHRGGMRAVGIGRAEQLEEADIVIPGFEDADIRILERKIEQREKGESL